MCWQVVNYHIVRLQEAALLYEDKVIEGLKPFSVLFTSIYLFVLGAAHDIKSLLVVQVCVEKLTDGLGIELLFSQFNDEVLFLKTDSGSSCRRTL